MNQTENKHILNALKTTLEEQNAPEAYREIQNLGDSMDLISELRRNLEGVFSDEKRLGFMISEVQTSIKRRL